MNEITTPKEHEIITGVLVNGKLCDPETVEKIRNLKNPTLSRAGMMIISNKPVRNDKHFNDMKKLELHKLADALTNNSKMTFTGETKEYFIRLYKRITGFNETNSQLPIITRTDLMFLYSSLHNTQKNKIDGLYDLSKKSNVSLLSFEKTVDLLCFAIATNSIDDIYNNALAKAREAECLKIIEIRKKKTKNKVTQSPQKIQEENELETKKRDKIHKKLEVLKNRRNNHINKA